MENSGNNRYELLFMDDDAATAAPIVNAPKKKTVQATSVSLKKSQSNSTTNKENKSNALNNSESGRKTGNKDLKPISKELTADEKIRRKFPGEEREVKSVNFRPSESGENREQRNNRRNIRDWRNGGTGGEGGDDHRQQRQLKDRENRGNRFGDNGFRGGKREFDRQSGSDKTGVKAIDKRDGAGAHNWGSVKQEIDDVNKSNTETDAVLTDKEELATDQNIEQTAGTEEEEAETKEMTLDEWKALRKLRTKPQFNLRKAGEGEDTSQWKKMIVLNKKKDVDSEEEFEYDPSMYPQRVGRLQRIIDIQFNFKDGRRGGGGYGRNQGRGPRPGATEGGRFESGRGRGPASDIERSEGGRGNAGFRDGFRGNSNKPRNFGDRYRSGINAPKVDDERQFPTLS